MAIDLMTYEMAAEAADFIKAKYAGPIKTAIVLGSGLGAFADELTDRSRYPTKRSSFCVLRSRDMRVDLSSVRSAEWQSPSSRAAFIFTKATRWSRSRFRCVSSG